MRRLLFLAMVLGGAIPVAAAVIDTAPRPKVPPASADQVDSYAQRLVMVANRVNARFVRPVPRHELFYAALKGLYQAAGQSVPPGLAEELEKGIPDLPIAAIQDLQEISREAPLVDEDALVTIKRVRQRLGRLPGLDDATVFRASVSAMLRSLDPYSSWADPGEVRRRNGEQPFGFGLTIAPGQMVAGAFIVDQVLPGSPANRASIRPGDRIIKLNGTPVEEIPEAEMKPSEERGPEVRPVRFLMDPNVIPVGQPYRLRLTLQRREGGPSRMVTLDAAEFEEETVFGVRRTAERAWDYSVDAEHQIGYVRVGHLEFGTTAALASAIRYQRRDGMRALVLDLRWGNGGWLSEATGIASLFIPDGKIATIRNRTEREQESKVDGSAIFTDFPIIVLVNGETMGGSELIAAALQDNRRARIAGQRTFGKASVQTIDEHGLALPEGVLKLTTGTFWRPSGKPLHRFPDSRVADDWGIRPDANLEWRLTPEASQSLRRAWAWHTLRPFNNEEASVLDDLENDQQLLLAVRALVSELEKGPPVSDNEPATPAPAARPAAP